MSIDPACGGEGNAVDLLLSGGLVVTVNAEREMFHDGFVAVRNGVIVAVGSARDCTWTSARTIDTGDRVILPGFVNAHDHLVGVYVRGLGRDRFINVGAGSPEDPLSKPIRESVDEEAAYHGTRLALLELQKSGVTTTTDSQPVYRGMERRADGTLRAMKESGIRALYTRASHNRTVYVSPEKHDAIERAVIDLERLHQTWSSDRIEVGAEAHGLHRVEAELLKALKEWTRKRDVHFAMHLSFSKEAAEHSVERFGRPLMLLLQDWGVLDEKFLGYHPIWVTDEEIEAIARSGAGVAYCPVDNMLIGCGVAPIAKLLRAGVRLGFGVDQPNDGHNYFELMKLAILLQRIEGSDPRFGSPELALELATMGGARALHRESQIGSLEVGKAADIVVLDARRSPLNPFTGRLSNVVYAGSPAEVEHVFVGGDAVVRSGRHVQWDEEEVVQATNRAMRVVLQRAAIERKSWPVSSWPMS
jgi:5-methylthioadenosine/S-adenosylhomocysteine deaminase